jgi:putative salt-induced outer membrane protein YdiY
VAAVAAMLLNNAAASILVMKNGDRITGTVKKIWDGDVFIEPDYADEFAVDQDDVAYIVDSREMTVELEDGTELVGQMGVNADGKQVMFVDGSEVRVRLRALAELAEPEKFSDWNTRFDVSTAINRGNTNSENVKALFYTMYKRGKQRHTLDLISDNEEQNGIPTKERDFAQYNFNYDVSDPWFLGASASYERDPIKNQKFRYNFVPALGYSFFDDASRLLRLQAGAGYQAEESIDQGAPGAFNDGGAVAAFLLRLNWRFDFPKMEYFLLNQTTQAFYGRKNTSTQWSTGLRFDITDLLYLNTVVDYNVESKPLEGAQPEDLSILFGFGMEFD